MNKIKNLLLIDDDYLSNYLHQITIQESDLVENILVFESGIAAINYLIQTEKLPEIIFVDINMPITNCWDFLNEYEKYWKPGDSHIFLLSSSINQEDEINARNHPYINSFIGKPLTLDIFRKIIHELLITNML